MADTLELRTAFVDEWMWLDGPDPSRYTMVEILDIYDTELGAAGALDANFDAAAEYDEALDWLAERGYRVERKANR